MDLRLHTSTDLSAVPTQVDADLDFSTGDLQLLIDTESIRQHLCIRFKTFLGEWFLDQRIGVPHYTDVLIKNPNLQAVTTLFRDVILTTPGVESVSDLLLTFDAFRRGLAVNFSAVTSTGETLDFTETLIL